MEVGDPRQVSKVTLSGGIKNNPRLLAILQPCHPGVYFLKGYYWLVFKHENKTKQKTTTKKKMASKRRVLAVNSLISRLQSSPYFCVNSSTHEQSNKS